MHNRKRLLVEAWLPAIFLAVLAALMAGCADNNGGTTTTCDTTPPTVVSTVPVNGATGVSLSRNISARFSELMSPATINTSTMTLYQGATRITGTVSYSVTTNGVTESQNPKGASGPQGLTGMNSHLSFGGNSITGMTSGLNSEANSGSKSGSGETASLSPAGNATPSSLTGVVASFNPTNNLVPNTVYTATITTGAKDVAGNSLASNYVWTFTTGTTVDVTAPTVVSTVPANVATGVSVNRNLTATFSEEMDPLTISTATMIVHHGATPVVGDVTYAGLTANFNPTNDLDTNTDYTATITTDATDLAGNAIENEFTWTFTTGSIPDTTAPTVSSTVPINGATDVSTHGNILATFSEAMDPLTITTATMTIKQGATAVAGAVTYVGVTARFNPTADLTPSTVYTATITTGAKDLAGNAMVSNYMWTFTSGTTPDVTPPTVSSTVPVNAAIDVSLSGNLAATFSEAMDPLTITTSTIMLHRGANLIPGTVTYAGVTARFNPLSNLAPSTVYTATITSDVTDLAGNSLANDYVWTFTTGTTPDVTPPTVSSTVPFNNATGVSLGGNIAATFSEAMDPLTVTSANISLHQGATLIPGTVSYVGVTASFNPLSNLAPSTLYTARITTGVEDLAGNKMANDYVWTFTTGTTADIIPPTVSSTVPLNNAIDVPLGGNFTATFSEVMAPLTITSATVTLHQGAILINGTVTYNGSTANFNPTGNLIPSTVYTATVTTGVKDLAGNAMAHDYVWTFTTGIVADVTPPTVTSTVPEDSATGVSLNANITATFSEAMAPATINTNTVTLNRGGTPVPGAVTYSGVTMTFNPTATFSPSSVYTATIKTGVRDLAGNAMAHDYVWTFTTGAVADITPPTVTATVPEDSATGVSVNANIAATFSEAMAPATITTATMTLHHGATSVQGTVNYIGVTATFNPADTLAPSTVYTATITTGVKDLAGNAMAQDYVWTFTTGRIADVTPPTVTSTVPEDSTIGVSMNANIAAVFSEAMAPATITNVTMTLKQGNNAIAGAVTYAGVTATFNPTANLSPNTVYTATITTGAKDLAGNALAHNYVWIFTTGQAADVTPPTVASTVPVDSATSVAMNANITATFSEAMTPGTITNVTMTLKQGNNAIAGAVTYAGVTATFNPTADLSPSTVYTATITTGAKDLAGNALAHNYVWIFTTGHAADVTPPTVVSTVPADSATGVLVAANVTATFSEAMTPGTITNVTMTLNQGNNAIAGAVTYAGVVATFNPTANLALHTVYTATITTGVRDLAGNALAHNYVWTFTTVGAADTTRPIVRSTVPADSATGVLVNANVTATFSKVMAPATINATTMTLHHGQTLDSAVVTYAGVVATLNPIHDLTQHTVYTATITTGVTDTAHNAMAHNYVWTFTTVGAADTTRPVVLHTVPADSATGVSVSTNITATFSKLMDPATLIAANVTLKEGNNNIAGALTHTDTTVTFNPTANLTDQTEYTVTITTGVTDTAGHAMAHNYVWIFTTGLGGIDLGRAGAFAILAGSTVANTGGTIITGDLGVHPGAAVTGFPPGVVHGTVHAGDETARLAKLDLTTAYNDAAGRQVAPIAKAGNLGGQTLAPGLYTSQTSLEISAGDLTLDGGGNADAVWIFQMGSTLTTTAGRHVVLAGGAQAQNIYWQVGSSATLGTNSIFKGNILAQASITLTTGAVLDGRALTQTAAVTLDTNTVTAP